MVCALLLQAGRERSVHSFSHLLCCLLRHTDVPTPKLIGSGRQQFWFLISRMGELVATFPGLAPLCQQAVHGADRAVVLPFIEQGRVNRGRRAILKAFSMEMGQNRRAFRRTQGAYR